jgi:hypothetical protein
MRPISAWLEYLREAVDRGHKDGDRLLVKSLRKPSDFQQLKEKSADQT